MSEPIPDPSARAPQARRAPSAPRLIILNAIFPGLAHLVAGRTRWAAILALPIVLPLLALLAVAVATSATSLAARALDPDILTALLAVQLVLLAWRLFAIGAVRMLTPVRARGATIAAVLVAVVIVVGPQAVLASLTVDARDAAAKVFQPVGEGGAWVPDASAPPVASNDPDLGVDPSATPSLDPTASASDAATPSATPGVPRINVLLIGIDSGVGRNTMATDSMIVASLDPVGKTVSMLSVPRDMVDVPLPDGRIFKQKINGLVSYAYWHPKAFPGAKDGQSVLAAALGDLLGIKIDLWAQVNLGGFVDLVDSVGGINIQVSDAFCDYRYKEYGISGFNISPGWWHMNGDQALAYARVRKALGESDFTRAGRQQEVIAALRDKLVHGGFLDNPAAFLQAAGQTVSTNIKPSFIADWIDVASKVTRANTFRVVINHPLVRGMSDARGSIQEPDIPGIRALAAKLFTPTGIRPKGFDTMPAAGSGATRNASSSSTCGVTPPPKATPKPTPKPTATPKATKAPTPTPEPATPTPSAVAPDPTPSP